MNLVWTKRAARIDRLEGALALLSRLMHDVEALSHYTDDEEELDELLDIQQRIARYRRRYQQRRQNV